MIKNLFLFYKISNKFIIFIYESYDTKFYLKKKKKNMKFRTRAFYFLERSKNCSKIEFLSLKISSLRANSSNVKCLKTILMSKNLTLLEHARAALGASLGLSIK